MWTSRLRAAFGRAWRAAWSIEADDAVFFTGWLMVVAGLWRVSAERALVVGGALLIAAVVFGAVVQVLKKA